MISKSISQFRSDSSGGKDFQTQPQPSSAFEWEEEEDSQIDEIFVAQSNAFQRYMSTLKRFNLLERLKIQAPVIGIVTHRALGEAISERQNLQHLQIEYLSAKISYCSNRILELTNISEDLKDYLYDEYVEWVKKAKI